MNTAPLIDFSEPDDVLVWEGPAPITVGQFLSDVLACAQDLPATTTVLNLAQDRYRFMMGLSASILRGQVTLLPQNTAPKTLADIATRWPDCCCLTDGEDRPAPLPTFRLRRYPPSDSSSVTVPLIPLDQPIAVAFTSGTTGSPTASTKTWRALVNVAHSTGAWLKLGRFHRPSIVATVPHQHMFGLEASVMLALQQGCALHTGRPLFPADIQTALTDVPPGRLLVTTPLHIRALVINHAKLPTINRILSATAPLSRTLALAAELMFETPVHEIYGFAEAGSVAARRTIHGETWHPLDGVALSEEGDDWVVRAAYLPQPVRVPDKVRVQSDHAFTLHGRMADQVNIAGHRTSLHHLNHRLSEIPGVEDGVFFLPDEGVDAMTTRLMAFVVAPNKTTEEIRTALRSAIDPVFLPRPLFLVASLPRNATGKLTREALLKLAIDCHNNGRGDI